MPAISNINVKVEIENVDLFICLNLRYLTRLNLVYFSGQFPRNLCLIQAYLSLHKIIKWSLEGMLI